jgi:hypothetical protein
MINGCKPITTAQPKVIKRLAFPEYVLALNYTLERKSYICEFDEEADKKF